VSRFICPPGISDGAFQLRMDNIWFCKLLLLFKVYTKTDAGMQYRECAYVSVLEEYKGPRKQGHIVHILHILHILICLSTLAWVDQCQSTIVYEHSEQAQVLYVIPVSSILGHLPLVPVGATGTIIWILATYDIVCHIRYRMSRHTISYVLCWMSYTISYVRYRIYDIALLDIRYRMYDIVCFYDIVCQHAMSYALHTISYYTMIP
jgi:hypothetical protein